MSDFDLSKAVRAYQKIKVKRSELSKEFKDADAELVETQNKIKTALLEHLDSTGVESIRTTEGTFYRSVKTRYWTSDWESMHKFVLENEVPELLEKRVNQTHMRQYLEEHPAAVPAGLNVDSEYILSVRKK